MPQNFQAIKQITLNIPHYTLMIITIIYIKLKYAFLHNEYLSTFCQSYLCIFTVVEDISTMASLLLLKHNI